jgi:hypothetical protein
MNRKRGERRRGRIKGTRQGDQTVTGVGGESKYKKRWRGIG